jgi:hypothetical protein
MKRTILALTLTLALSSALPVRASAPISDIEVPTNGVWSNSGTISLYYAISELFALGLNQTGPCFFSHRIQLARP